MASAPARSAFRAIFSALALKLAFYVVTLWAALTVNFAIPRLMPGHPAGAAAVPVLGMLATRSLASLVSQQRSDSGNNRRRVSRGHV